MNTCTLLQPFRDRKEFFLDQPWSDLFITTLIFSTVLHLRPLLFTEHQRIFLLIYIFVPPAASEFLASKDLIHASVFPKEEQISMLFIQMNSCQYGSYLEHIEILIIAFPKVALTYLQYCLMFLQRLFRADLSPFTWSNILIRSILGTTNLEICTSRHY